MAFLTVSLVAMAFAFLGSLPLAGPVAVLVVSNAANGRSKVALQIAFGAAVAEGLYAFLAFWGFATFLARYPVVLPISRAVTAIVLVSLGIYFLRFKAKDAPEKSESKRGKFWVGFSVSILNPTLLLTWSAVTTFLYAHEIVAMTSWLAIPFGGFATLGILLWALMTVALMRRFRQHVPKSTLTWVVRAMGILLIGVALFSALSLVRYLTGKDHAAKRDTGHLADGNRPEPTSSTTL